MNKERIVWDIEANGLVPDSTRIWCLCAKVIDNDIPIELEEGELNRDMIENIFSSRIIIGHNIINYDIPMLRKFYNIDLVEVCGKENIVDTYLWSQVLYPDRPMPKGCPEVIYNPVTKKSKKIGPHGLEAWGYRVGYKKIEIHDWTKFDENIIKRCNIDVEINVKTYFELLKEGGIDESKLF